MANYRTSTVPPIALSLALGGGAARGTFHLGFIAALQENNVEIKAISGSSAGALIGGAIACGVSPKRLLEIFKSKEFKKVFKWNWFKKALFRIDTNTEILNEIFPFHDLNETNIPFYCCVLNIDSQENLYLKDGEAKVLIAASCGLLPIFEPIYYHDNIFADGGITDLVPITPLLDLGYPILSINLIPTKLSVKHTFLSLTKRIWQLLWSGNIQKTKENSTWYIAPDELSRISMFSFNDLDKAYNLGYTKGLEWYIQNNNYPLIPSALGDIKNL